jgi:hypothetical protein
MLAKKKKKKKKKKGLRKVVSAGTRNDNAVEKKLFLAFCRKIAKNWCIMGRVLWACSWLGWAGHQRAHTHSSSSTILNTRIVAEDQTLIILFFFINVLSSTHTSSITPTSS